MINRIQMAVGGLLADFGLWLYWNARIRKICKSKKGEQRNITTP
jgi:hypothetical protein